MIKLYCDRCGKEINGAYYTLAFTKHYIDSAHRISEITGLCGTIDALVTCIEPTELEKLQSKKVYCSECKKEIENIDFKKENNADIANLIEELKNNDKFQNIVEQMTIRKLCKQ